MADALQYNWGVFGHDEKLRELESDMREGNIAHAYLLAGSDNIGKFLVAKKMAHILQCENNYCHDCAVCHEIEKGYHSDTLEIVDDGESLKIEEIRAVLTRLHLSKQSPYKILLIQNIERMPLEAANAMLKILEDPPERVVFILTTSRQQEVLATIISRVRLFRFKRLGDLELQHLLHELYPLTETDQVAMLSSLALGRPGVAVSFMEKPELYDVYRKMYDDIYILLKKPDIASQFMYISDLVKSKKEHDNSELIRDFLDIFVTVARKELLDAVGRGDIEQERSLVKLVTRAQKGADLLKHNVNVKLLLENLMLHV